MSNYPSTLDAQIGLIEFCRYLARYLSWLALVVSSAAMAAPFSSADPGQDEIPVAPGACRGVVLLVHGLNLRPDKMRPIADRLKVWGYHVQWVVLSGHDMDNPEGERAQRFARATPQVWQSTFYHGYQLARAHAVRCGGHVSLVAYSLGAVVALATLTERPDIGLDSAVLLAPAVWPKWYGGVLRWLPLPGRVVIPSLSPKAYRANSGTPLAAYRALFSMAKAVRAHPEVLSRIGQGRVLMSPHDELVDFQETAHWAASAGIRWQVVPLRKGPDARTSIQHLVIDVDALGRVTWETMMACLRRTLAGKDCQFMADQATL